MTQHAHDITGNVEASLKEVVLALQNPPKVDGFLAEGGFEAGMISRVSIISVDHLVDISRRQNEAVVVCEVDVTEGEQLGCDVPLYMVYNAPTRLLDMCNPWRVRQHAVSHP